LLALVEPGRSLGGVLDDVDWAGVTPQQICYAVLGSLPPGALPIEGSARERFEALLLSPAFQEGFIAGFLAAYPEKNRRFFVHVPRSGGTSLGEGLQDEVCLLSYNALSDDWARGEVFLETVARLCRSVERHDTIHVSGHFTLRWLLDRKLTRFGDQIWTSFRDPRQLIVSYVNYVLTTLDGDPDLVRPDARVWAGRLGLTAPVGPMTRARGLALLPRMIEAGDILPHDLLCHFLGDGTAGSAIDLMVRSGIEVIASSRLDEWRAARWALPLREWANVSRGFVSWEDLSPRLKRRLSGFIRQDRALYRVVAPKLMGRVSILASCLLGDVPLGGERSRRVGRVRRSIVREPYFSRPVEGVGPMDPPLDFRTIETTLRLPFFDTRVWIRYARRGNGRRG